LQRAILQGMGKARGGGSGQGRSPALAGGKGKARVDNVVKKISNKAVQRKPPAGGAGGESSGRASPPPPQVPVPACPPGSAAAAAGERPPLPSAPRPRESWRHAVYAPREQGGADGGAAGKRKAHAMTADDDETVRQVVGMITPSDTESEEESGCPPAASPGEQRSGPWTPARLKKRKLERKKADRALYRRMDAAAEESAAERGLLIPSLLAQLKEDEVAGKQPLEDGSEFTCKAQLMLNVAAYNELHHKRFTARNGSKNNGGGGGEISCRNSESDYVASCCGNGDCTFHVKVRCVLPPVVHV